MDPDSNWVKILDLDPNSMYLDPRSTPFTAINHSTASLQYPFFEEAETFVTQGYFYLKGRTRAKKEHLLLNKNEQAWYTHGRTAK